MLETLDYTIRIGNTPTILYFGSVVEGDGLDFGISIIFQDEAMVMLFYWRKYLLLVGAERKEILWTRDGEGL